MELCSVEYLVEQKEPYSVDWKVALMVVSKAFAKVDSLVDMMENSMVVWKAEN
jgi:hypothetical protein